MAMSSEEGARDSLGVKVVGVLCCRVGHTHVAVLVGVVMSVLGCLAGSAWASAVLPEGRAYELVSPLGKGGYGAGERLKAAPDGESVAFTSIGVFVGEPTNSEAFNRYLSQRGAGGWETRALALPSTSEVNTEPPEDFSVDLSKSLTRARLGQNRGRAVHEATTVVYYLSEPDGSFVQASPPLTPKNGEVGTVGYLGGSSDLSYLVLQVQGGHALLPSDTMEQGEELYGIAGAGGSSPTLQLVGVNEEGKVIDTHCETRLGGRGTRFHAISSDGSEIFFTTNTEPGEGTRCLGNAANPEEIFLRAKGSETVEVSRPLEAQCTEEPCLSAKTAKPKTAEFRGASEDGSKVFFTTTQPLVNGDKNTKSDLYEAVIEGEAVNELVQISHDPSVGKAAEVQGVARISDDGSHVYFVAKGVLSTSPNAEGLSAVEGAENFYVSDTSTREPPAFIGELCSGHEESGSLGGVAQCPGEGSDEPLWEESDEGRPVQSTPDGRFLVFSTFAQLTPDDTDTAADVYNYDAFSGRLTRVSLGEEGYNHNGNNDGFGARLARPDFLQGSVSFQHELESRAISDDGSTIVFATEEPLSPRAVNNRRDVYQWHEGQVGLISSGTSPEADGEDVITPSGRDVFFTTTAGLVPQDNDSLEDVYDARIGGGLPVLPAPVGGCAGDACQGPLSAEPAFLSASSLTQASGGNLAPPLSGPPPKPKTKPKAKHRRKGRRAHKSTGFERTVKHPRRGRK
jgi:hypothetical protein